MKPVGNKSFVYGISKIKTIRYAGWILYNVQCVVFDVIELKFKELMDNVTCEPKNKNSPLIVRLK